MADAVTLATPLHLPCGQSIPNRIAKAAMSEQLGDRGGQPTTELVTLYRRWAHGGAGLLVTGNVAVDRTQLIEPYNVVLDQASDLGPFASWAEAARSSGAQAWLQLNHPGRQAPRVVTRRSVAPSAVSLPSRFGFAPPRVLTDGEIEALVDRFGRAAALAEAAGFTGIQVHAAHGYLVSQFLSPLANQRTDGWGGSLEHRARFLLEVVRAIRGAVSDSTAVAVKLNSADFQRGGFTADEAMEVVDLLNREGVDLLEITGGNFEAPRLFEDVGVRRSTREREAHFLEYARQARAVARMPIMLTGGIRTVETMHRIVAAGDVDIVGLARAVAVVPDLPARALAGHPTAVPRPRRRGVRPVDLLLESPWHGQQIRRMARGRDPRPSTGPIRTAVGFVSARLRWRLGRAGLI